MDQPAPFLSSKTVEINGVRALASCHLGGHRFGELAQAGLVRELAPGALLRADAMFQPERAPWCQGEF